MSKDDFPSLLVVSGSQDLLRLRFLKGVIKTQRDVGWTIENVDGTDAGAVRDALDGGGLFSTQRTLAVIHDPEKVNLDLITRHAEVKNSLTTLLLHIDGDPDGRTKFGKLVKKMGSVHKSFPQPTEWKAPEEAAAFVVSEARTYGMSVTPALAVALVGKVGVDLGVLSFEVEKAAILAKVDESKALTKVHIKGAMAPIAEASVAPIMDALASRSRKRLHKALVHFERTTKGDQTIRITRLLGATVLKWVAAVHLGSLPPHAAAQQLGLNPWYFENKILPPAKRWGQAGTVRLASDLAAAERAVLNGAISPWTLLTARLLAAC